jgi:hypothetical protein
MNTPRRNLLIGQGERLFQDGVWPPPQGDKPEPYTRAQQQSALLPALAGLAEAAQMRSKALAPRGEIAAKITIHPQFLAKSYFPTSLLQQTGLRLIGSRAKDVTPRRMVKGKPLKELPTAVLIVAGQANNFIRAQELLTSSRTSNTVEKQFNRIERIEAFDAVDRKLGLDLAHFTGWAEIVLHASFGDGDIRERLYLLSEELGAHFERGRARTVGGLTFLPVYTSPDSSTSYIRGIEEFSHLRMIRNMPILSEDPVSIDADISRAVNYAPDLPVSVATDPDLRAIIFDGGFTAGALPWVQAYDAPGVPTAAPDLPHGHAVTSAFLFGPIDPAQTQLPVPFCNVDHVRVLPSTASDARVADVIERILATLQNARNAGVPYTLANLSLGPRMPIVDDDPHEWTVRLDDFLSLGDLFMTVAVGNDGAHGPDLGRIQPPADAVNAFAVGSCEGSHHGAARAPYSCLGPGRSPGLVKPDAVAFGGVRGTPLRLVEPISGELREHYGTSYSAPLALRLAAGIKASVAQDIQPIMLHALLVSRAMFHSRRHDQTEVGWGVLPKNIDDILYSSPDEVVVMYQGLIAKGQPIRAKVPLPKNVSPSGKVRIAATFAYRALVDPAHPVNYTRAGLEVRFQPDGNSSDGFFSATKYDVEQTLRTDALKWETCRHREKSKDIETLTDPCFVIRYQGREEGAPDAEALKDASGRLLPAADQPSALPFALVVRVRVPGVVNLAEQVLTQFSVLNEVSIRSQVST